MTVIFGSISVILMGKIIYTIALSGRQSAFPQLSPSSTPAFFQRDSISNEPGINTPAIPKEFNLDKAQNLIGVFKAAAQQSELYQKASFEIVYSGTVTFSRPINENLGGQKYIYSIGLTTAEKTAELKVNQAEYLTTQTFFVTPQGQTLGRIENIKAGDLVTIKETYNILDMSPYRNLTLEVKSH